jgi:hypothetical protein
LIQNAQSTRYSGFQPIIVCLFLANPANAAIPAPNVSNVPGSGTEVVGSGVTTVPPLSEFVTERPPLKPVLPERMPEQVVPIVFICSDTCPVLARTLPQSSVAPVFMLMLASARIFPSNALYVPMVAELPTFQKIPAPGPVLITLIFELDAVPVVAAEVVKVLAI